MCIICDMTKKGGVDAANEFLTQFSNAQNCMQRATIAMLEVRHNANSEDRKRYDRTHKKMVRLLREWNRIEHERGVHTINKTEG